MSFSFSDFEVRLCEMIPAAEANDEPGVYVATKSGDEINVSYLATAILAYIRNTPARAQANALVRKPTTRKAVA